MQIAVVYTGVDTDHTKYRYQHRYQSTLEKKILHMPFTTYRGSFDTRDTFSITLCPELALIPVTLRAIPLCTELAFIPVTLKAITLCAEIPSYTSNTADDKATPIVLCRLQPIEIAYTSNTYLREITLIPVTPSHYIQRQLSYTSNTITLYTETALLYQ